MANAVVEWAELEALLNKLEWTEQKLVLDFELGFYSTREWKRRNRVPKWMIVALTHIWQAMGTSVAGFVPDGREALARIFLHQEELDQLDKLKAEMDAILEVGMNRKKEDDAMAAAPRKTGEFI